MGIKDTKAEFVDFEPGSLHWLEWRHRGLGSSDAPVVMGVSPWKTRYQLWEEKTSELKVEEFTGNFATERGHRMEPMARAQYEVLHETEMPPANLVHPDYSYIRASLDGFNKRRHIVLEIKCPGREDHALASMGKVPEKYIPQVQHQLLVSGAHTCHYFSFDGEVGHLVVVKRDELYIKELIRELRSFWKLIVDGTPPELSDRDYVEATDVGLVDLLADWKAKKIKIEEEMEKLDEMRRQIIYLAPHSRFRGSGVRVVKYMKKGSIDYKRIPELDGVDLDLYRKAPSEVVTFSLEKKDEPEV